MTTESKNNYVFCMPRDWDTHGTPTILTIQAETPEAALDQVREYVAKTKIKIADSSLMLANGTVDFDDYMTRFKNISESLNQRTDTKKSIDEFCIRKPTDPHILLKQAVALAQPEAKRPETKAENKETKATDKPLVLRSKKDLIDKTIILHADGKLEQQELNGPRKTLNDITNKIWTLFILTSEGPEVLETLTPGRTPADVYKQIYALPLPSNVTFLKKKLCGCYGGRCRALVGYDPEIPKTYGELFAKFGTQKTVGSLTYAAWNGNVEMNRVESISRTYNEGACYGPEVRTEKLDPTKTYVEWAPTRNA